MLRMCTRGSAMVLLVALFLVANNATTGAPTLSGKVAHGDIICSLFGDGRFCGFPRRMLVPRNREKTMPCPQFPNWL